MLNISASCKSALRKTEEGHDDTQVKEGWGREKPLVKEWVFDLMQQNWAERMARRARGL